MSVPILYSLQHCPYAMRARMALLMARQSVLLRAVVTKDKPEELLKISPKATVPVLLFEDGSIIDESLDIMIWALQKNDPTDLLYIGKPEIYPQMLNLISICDHEFRTKLSAYKHAKRYHQPQEIELRSQCEKFIQKLESSLQKQEFIMGSKLSLADLAILPFVRQFVNVDKKWFRSAAHPHLSRWLESMLQSLLFTKAMRKYPLWLECREEFLLSWD
ncbi:MAG: glutathione S-transferase [Bacteriovoracaceae bacterium]|nr:glutathione S-transferase [Bacteriovoracaceae bacterium]